VTPPVPGVIRAAAPRDLDRIAALWTALAAHHARIDPLFRQRPGSDPTVRALLAAQLRHPDAALYVCDVDGDLVGFCGVRLDRGPPVFEEVARVEITDLGVREGLRRRGIGRALCEAALGWASGRGQHRVEVRVAAGNAEGQGFWRALGFEDLMDVLQRRL
jgi:ribosomal protein S18 acetylase RimI-like enzyme